jgi:formylglycine-generating enzyme required for sulfatase activity
MAGNVWEWTRDCYDEHFYKRSPEKDPFNEERKMAFGVLRGGSWNALPRDCRISKRLKSHPDNTATDRGFRGLIEL